MGDRTAANIGFVAAGVALAVTLLQWPGPRGVAAAGVAGVAFAGLALRRYGRAHRSRIAPVVWLAGAGLVVLASMATVTPIPGTGVDGVVRGVVAVSGVVLVLTAVADWQGIGRDRLLRMAGGTATGAAIGIAGLAAIFVWGGIIVTVADWATPGSIGGSTGTALATLAGGLGTGSVALVYFRNTDRGLGFIDIRRPERRDLGYVIAGLVVIIVLNLLLGVAIQRFGLESASHSIVRSAQSNPEVLLVLVPLSYLVIGPGEELLYRNVVQKSLYDVFSRPGSIVVASLIFAGVHFFSFSDPAGNVVATVTTLAVVFALSLVLGTVYARTDNIVVPALVHGTFNAIAFSVEYVDLTGFGAVSVTWLLGWG